MVALLLALLFLAGVAHADGETCTLGPYDSGDTYATLDAAIDGAGDNAVLCLLRGETWANATGPVFSVSGVHPNASRVLVCASDASKCTASGGANPKFIVTGAVWSLATGTQGYTFRNIDGLSNVANNSSVVGVLNHNTRYLTWEGGTFTEFLKFTSGMGGGGANGTSVWNPRNITVGICGNPVEVTGGTDPNQGIAIVAYGVCRDCSFSLNVHDHGTTGTDQYGKGHFLDFAAWEPGRADDGWSRSQNITVECSTFESSSLDTSGVGAHLKFSQGNTAVIRDNEFHKKHDGDSGAYCMAGMTFGKHTDGNNGDKPGEEQWLGAEIYRNVFDYEYCTGFSSSRGSTLNVHNNVFISKQPPAGQGQPPVAIDIDCDQNYCGPCPSSTEWCPFNSHDAEPDDILIYNNSFYHNMTPNLTGNAAFISEGGTATGHELVNNVFYVLSGTNLRVWEGTCSNWGTSGVGIKTNWVYTPSDSDVPYWSACTSATAATGNSHPFNDSGDNPGLTDPTNASASVSARFDITGTSAVYLKGTLAGAPATDYDQVSRPSPPSIGAFDWLDTGVNYMSIKSGGQSRGGQW